MEYYSVDELEIEENDMLFCRLTDDHFNTKIDHMYIDVRNFKLLFLCSFIISFLNFPAITTLYMVLVFDACLPEAEDDIEVVSANEVLKQISHDEFINQNPPILNLASPLHPEIDDYFGLMETTLNTENALMKWSLNTAPDIFKDSIEEAFEKKNLIVINDLIFNNHFITKYLLLNADNLSLSYNNKVFDNYKEVYPSLNFNYNDCFNFYNNTNDLNDSNYFIKIFSSVLPNNKTHKDLLNIIFKNWPMFYDETEDFESSFNYNYKSLAHSEYYYKGWRLDTSKRKVKNMFHDNESGDINDFERMDWIAQEEIKKTKKHSLYLTLNFFKQSPLRFELFWWEQLYPYIKSLENDYELFNNKFNINKSMDYPLDLTANNFLPYKRYNLISKKLNKLVFDDWDNQLFSKVYANYSKSMELNYMKGGKNKEKSTEVINHNHIPLELLRYLGHRHKYQLYLHGDKDGSISTNYSSKRLFTF